MPDTLVHPGAGLNSLANMLGRKKLLEYAVRKGAVQKCSDSLFSSQFRRSGTTPVSDVWRLCHKRELVFSSTPQPHLYGPIFSLLSHGGSLVHLVKILRNKGPKYVARYSVASARGSELMAIYTVVTIMVQQFCSAIVHLVKSEANCKGLPDKVPFAPSTEGNLKTEGLNVA